MRELYATIDLGSNSFHMLVAALEHDEIKILESNSEKVMLAEGLSKKSGIHPLAMTRGLDCISRFAQRIENIPNENIRIVGTNTLRAAVNADSYVTQLEKRLKDIPIEIVSGIEEARLVYLGVNHSWSSLSQYTKNLVIDIGGGSTEFIIGKNFKLKRVESLRMGCVAFRRYFPNDEITPRYFKDAFEEAKFQLRNIKQFFIRKSWEHAVGSAGTFKQIEKLLIEQKLTEEGITLKDLNSLKGRVLSFNHMSQLSELGIKPARALTLVPGIAIALAIFKSLSIEKLYIARGGLREGALYDLLGRLKHEDIRQRSICAVARRYHVNNSHSQLLSKVAIRLCQHLEKSGGKALNEKFSNLLKWSVQCCHIGLSINHSQYQNHSAYLLQNSELSGFSLNDRKILALMVQNQRRKIQLGPLDTLHLSFREKKQFIKAIFVLRLTVIICQNGKANGSKNLSLSFDGRKITISSTDKWLNRHSLIAHALEIEKKYWHRTEYSLNILSH